MTSTADPFASTRTAAGLPSVRWECVSCADGSIEGEVAENAGRQVLHGRGLKVTLEGRIIAGLWTHGRLRGCGVVLNAADELTCSETWLQQPGGSLRTEGTSETFPLRPALASPEAHALQSALATVLRLAGSLRHQAMALEASGSCWAVEVEEDTREVLRLVLSRYGVHMRTCTAQIRGHSRDLHPIQVRSRGPRQRVALRRGRTRRALRWSRQRHPRSRAGRCCAARPRRGATRR